MRSGIALLLAGIGSFLLMSGCKSSANLVEKDIYFSNLSHLTYTAHEGYAVVAPCKNDEILVVMIHSLLVEYDFLKKAPQYKTFKEYIMAVVDTPGLYDCGERGGYAYKDTEMYQDYLKIGFDAFLEKYTEDELSWLSEQESNERILKKEIVDKWGDRTVDEIYATVKIMFDHGYYIKELGSLDFYFLKTFEECRQRPRPPIPPNLPLPPEK